MRSNPPGRCKSALRKVKHEGMSMSTELPLFPLQTVLFPGGFLSLNIFEARYLDLIGTCLREQKPFGVVALRDGREVRRADEAVSFETVGTLAELMEADSDQPGIIQITCQGTQRFRVLASHQQSDGLWLASVEALPDDDAVAPEADLHGSVVALKNMMAKLQSANAPPILEPHRFDDAGWVANRWCELLPVSRAAKQKLMELDDPAVRLELVDDFLRSKGVVNRQT